MPARTKQGRKKSSVKRQTNISVSSSTQEDVLSLTSKDYASPEEFFNEFEEYYKKRVEARKQAYESACALIKKVIKDKLDSYPPEFRKMSINDPLPKDLLCKIRGDSAERNSSGRQSRLTRTCSVSEDTIEFKKPKTPRAAPPYRKRSASASAIPSSSDKCKTPLMSSRKMPPGHTITPKIYSDTPMSVMRRPAYGEVAVSLTGSPLMVGSILQEDIPTVSVPLRDGRVFSIMPEKGAPPPDLPEFDEQTKEYLRTLQAHLAILAPCSP